MLLIHNKIKARLSKSLVTDLERIYRLSSISHKVCGLQFVSASEMRSLNSTFRQKRKTTEVISFEYDDPEMAGEVFIGIWNVNRFCRLQGQKIDSLRIQNRIKNRFIHSLCHLMGYSHDTDNDHLKVNYND